MLVVVGVGSNDPEEQRQPDRGREPARRDRSADPVTGARRAGCGRRRQGTVCDVWPASWMVITPPKLQTSVDGLSSAG